MNLWSFDLRFPLLWLPFCQLVFVSVCVHTKQQGRGGVKVMGDLHVMESGPEGAGTGVACQHTTEGTCMVN